MSFKLIQMFTENNALQNHPVLLTHYTFLEVISYKVIDYYNFNQHSFRPSPIKLSILNLRAKSVHLRND